MVSVSAHSYLSKVLRVIPTPTPTEADVLFGVCGKLWQVLVQIYNTLVLVQLVLVMPSECAHPNLQEVLQEELLLQTVDVSQMSSQAPAQLLTAAVRRDVTEHLVF